MAAEPTAAPQQERPTSWALVFSGALHHRSSAEMLLACLQRGVSRELD